MVKSLRKVLVPKESVTGTVAGTDDSLGRGPDIALSTAVFLVLGLAIDSGFDTRPLFAIALVVLSLVGNFARMWYVYDGRMKVLEQQRHEKSVSHQARGVETSVVQP